MDSIIDFLKTNFDAVSAAPIAFIALLCIAFIVAYMLVALSQAGYVKYLETQKLMLERQVRELEQATPPQAKTFTQPTELTASVQLPELAGPLCQHSCRLHFISIQSNRGRQVIRKCESTKMNSKSRPYCNGWFVR